MTWRQRLREMLLAGGALTSVACGSNTDGGAPAIPCGNANPDPCICGRPDADPKFKQECDQKLACAARGGVWGFGGAPCVCGSQETDPVLKEACDQLLACEARGGDPFWDIAQQGDAGGGTSSLKCEPPAGTGDGSSPVDAGANGDEID